MNKQDKITLVKTEYNKDQYGVNKKIETTRDIFADIQSVSAREFFEGANTGLKPVYRMDVYVAEYEEEKVIIYQGKRYAIYRTYQSRLDIIELYVQEEIGA